MIQLSYKQQIAFNSLSIIAGNALYALTVVLFLVPSGLITGAPPALRWESTVCWACRCPGCCLPSTSACWCWAGWYWAAALPLPPLPAPSSARCFWPCGSGCLQILCSPMIWCSTPSLPVWAWASRWASPSVPVLHRRHGHPSSGAQQVVPPAGVGDHDGVRPDHSGGAGAFSRCSSACMAS